MVHETTEDQECDEHKVNPRESDDGVEDAADFLGTKTPEKVGPPALLGGEHGIACGQPTRLTERTAAPTRYMNQMIRSKAASIA
jgi:hypothetical protein